MPRPVSGEQRPGGSPGRTLIQYTLADGRVVERVSPGTARKAASSRRPGPRVLIWYDPEDPQDVLVDGREGGGREPGLRDRGGDCSSLPRRGAGRASAASTSPTGDRCLAGFRPVIVGAPDPRRSAPPGRRQRTGRCAGSRLRLPATRTTAATTAAWPATGAAAKAATATSGAGAMASSSADHVTASGIALTSAEMVISWAAPARTAAAADSHGPARRSRYGRRRWVDGDLRASCGCVPGAHRAPRRAAFCDSHEHRADQSSRHTYSGA